MAWLTWDEIVDLAGKPEPQEVHDAHELMDSELEPYYEEPYQPAYWNINPFASTHDSYTVY